MEGKIQWHSFCYIRDFMAETNTLKKSTTCPYNSMCVCVCVCVRVCQCVFVLSNQVCE